MKAVTGITERSDSGKVTRYISEPAFTLDEIELTPDGYMVRPADTTRFGILCALSDGQLAYGTHTMDLRKGDSVFIPAAAPELTLEGGLHALLMAPGRK